MHRQPLIKIFHHGRDHCHRVTFGLWRAIGHRQAKGNPTVLDWTPHLGVGDISEDAVLTACRQQALGVAGLRSLPYVVPVIVGDRGSDIEGLTDNLQLTLAVLARCSGTVFLRRKSPIITASHIVRSVTLIFPRGWSFDR